MTAGDMGRPWAAIHDNSRIPVAFRLYLTATPRILAAPSPQRGKDGRELVIASMEDDSATYGTRIFDLGLAEAVERSILAGFGLGLVEGLTKVFYPEAASTVVFVMMALVILVKPNGLFGAQH